MAVIHFVCHCFNVYCHTVGPNTLYKVWPPLAKCMVCVVTIFALTGLLPGVVFCKVVGMICNYYLEGPNRQASESADRSPPQMAEFEHGLDEDFVLIEDVPDTDPDFINSLIQLETNHISKIVRR